MQRAERRQAEREGRTVRTLMESDYLLGVADETRLGALRFRHVCARRQFHALKRAWHAADAGTRLLEESTEESPAGSAPLSTVGFGADLGLVALGEDDAA
jgi:hypothetical protein